MATVTHGFVEFKLYLYNLEEIKKKQIQIGFEKSIKENRISLSDLHSKKIVFNSLFEGHGKREFLAVLESLKSESWFDANRIVFLNNVSGEFDPPIKSVSWPWNMVNHSEFLDHVRSLQIDWDSLPRDRYFVCLMRRRSNFRGMLLKQLLTRYRPEDYRISYASMIDYEEFDSVAGVQIPILLDGHTRDHKQHQANDRRIFSCIINIIAETSSQELSSYCWNSRFITEKTFKCFSWHQLPIWWTIPGFVDDVRSLGFDVFDDVMENHHYDSEFIVDRRMMLMLETLDRVIEKISLHGIDNFNKEMMPRFKKNYQRLIDLSDRRIKYWPTIIERIQNV